MHVADMEHLLLDGKIVLNAQLPTAASIHRILLWLKCDLNEHNQWQALPCKTSGWQDNPETQGLPMTRW